jgi:uncharacterized membrane protein
MKKDSTRLSWLMLLILLAATLAYFTGIGKESLWLDETISVRYSQGSLQTLFNFLSEDVHLPLYFLILWGWIKMFGTSELAVRSLSAVFGLLAVFAIYLVGRKLFNERTGLFAAALLAVSPFFTYYAQDVRMYEMLGFFSLMSVYFYAKLREEPDVRGAVPYLIFSLLMLYTHPYSVLVLIVENIHFVVCCFRGCAEGRARGLFHWISIQCAVAALFLPGIWMMISNSGNLSQVLWIHPSSVVDLAGTFSDFSGSVVAVVASLILLLASFRRENFNRLKEKYRCSHLLVLLWVFAPIILVFVFSLVFRPMYVERYLIPSFLGYTLWLAWLMQNVSKRRIVQTGVLTLFVLFSIFQLAARYSAVDVEDVRSLSAYLAGTVSSDDTILVVPFYQQNTLTYYYAPDCLKSSNMNRCNFLEKNIISLDYTSKCCDSKTRLTGGAGSRLGDYTNTSMWVVSIRDEVYDRNNSIFKYLNSTKNLTSTREFPGGVFLFRFE